MKINVDFDVEKYKELCIKLEEYQGKYDMVIEKQIELDERLDSLIDEEDRLNESNIYLEEEKKKLIREKMISDIDLIKVGFPIVLTETISSIFLAVDGFGMQYAGPIIGMVPITILTCPLVANRINLKRKNKVINSEEYGELNDKILDNAKKIEKTEKKIEVLESKFQKSCDEVDYWQKLIDEVKKEIDMYKNILFESVERQIDNEDIEIVEHRPACKKRTLVNVSEFKK